MAFATIPGLERRKYEIRAELRQKNEEVIEQLQDVRKINDFNFEIYEDMTRYDKLTIGNRQFLEACHHLSSNLARKRSLSFGQHYANYQ